MTSQDPARLTVVPIDESNRAIFNHLIQCYECEFSSITEKSPDKDGIFPLDTHLDDSHKGFLAYLGETPAGFNLIALKGNNHFEVCEFFVIPVFRKRGIGYHIAAAIFDLYPGEWEIKQISGADGAKAFWRRAIGRYTGERHREDVFTDPYWGVVTRQLFDNSRSGR